MLQVAAAHAYSTSPPCPQAMVASAAERSRDQQKALTSCNDSHFNVRDRALLRAALARLGLRLGLN